MWGFASRASHVKDQSERNLINEVHNRTNLNHLMISQFNKNGYSLKQKSLNQSVERSTPRPVIERLQVLHTSRRHFSVPHSHFVMQQNTIFPHAHCTKQTNIGLSMELTTAGISAGQIPQDVSLEKGRHHHLPHQVEYGLAGIVDGSLGGHVQHHWHACNVMGLVAPAPTVVPSMATA